jgi:hypothetical protein
MLIDYPFGEIGKAILANERLKNEGVTVSYTVNKVLPGTATMVHRIQIPDDEWPRANEILTRFGLGL